jgi:hypothetical protein
MVQCHELSLVGERFKGSDAVRSSSECVKSKESSTNKIDALVTFRYLY